jgi:hypothetical protein
LARCWVRAQSEILKGTRTNLHVCRNKILANSCAYLPSLLLLSLVRSQSLTYRVQFLGRTGWRAQAHGFCESSMSQPQGMQQLKSVGYGLLRSCDLSLLSSVIDLRQLIASRSTHATKEARIRDRNFPTSEIASRFKDLARNGTGNARIKPRRR